MTNNAQAKRELGYKIKEIEDENGKFRVLIETPEKDLKTKVFTFGPDMTETKKYVDDGEIKEDPKWKIRVENTLDSELEEEENESELDTQQLEKYKGERLKP